MLAAWTCGLSSLVLRNELLGWIQANREPYLYPAKDLLHEMDLNLDEWIVKHSCENTPGDYVTLLAASGFFQCRVSVIEGIYTVWTTGAVLCADPK